MITSVEPEGSGTEYALPSMMERRVDGILLAAPQMEDDRALGHVLDRALPVVSLHHIAGAALTTVGPDDEQAGRLATRHLVELGHRTIGVVSGVRGRRLTQNRMKGYRHALDDAGIAFSADLLVEGGDTVQGGVDALPRLFQQRPDITAVLCHHDLVAVGALTSLRKLDRKVPGECSIVGCDDLNSAAYTNPPLTTVHVPFYEIGAEAMRLLLKMITGGAGGGGHVTLPVHLVTRASTAPSA
jgi:LacI family transcriptional regulator